MTRCPSCFVELEPALSAWACASGKCKPEDDSVMSEFLGEPLKLEPVTVLQRPADAPRGWRPKPAACRVCAGPTREVCPECHYRLADEWRSGVTLCLALAGARATGKSVYIGVLVKLMQTVLAERLGTQVDAADPRTLELYQGAYERVLFEQRNLLPATTSIRAGTAQQREPLVWRLGMVRGRRHFIVIRDVAGEDLESPSGLDARLRFFRNADGVLFLFDPLAVEEVRHALQGRVPEQLHRGGDPATVLGSVLSLVGDRRPRIGIALSKFDAMHALRDVEGAGLTKVMSNSGAAFLRESPDEALWRARDPQHLQPRDDSDGRLLHLEIRSLLQRLNAVTMINALENPASGVPINHRFFAVSALGESPDGERLNPRGISPFRCLDPLTWLLDALWS